MPTKQRCVVEQTHPTFSRFIFDITSLIALQR